MTATGTLIADGTPVDKIVFTSIKDDSYGGDTNDDGSGGAPAAGAWEHIAIANSTTLIDNAVIKYGGRAVGMYPVITAGAVNITGGSPIITNSMISNNMTYAIKTLGSSSPIILQNTITNTQPDPAWSISAEGSAIYSVDSSAPRIDGNTISNNASHGIHCSDQNATTPTITGNVISNNSGSAIYAGKSYPMISGNTATGNNRNGITITSLSGSGTLYGKDLPYIVSAIYSIEIVAGSSLTIEPGTIVKFECDSFKRLTATGTLIANGTPADKIVFTSIKDDSYGGDTNNDGSASAPAPGNWENIILTNSDSILDNVVVKYGGRHYAPTPPHTHHGAVYVSAGSPTISNSEITQNHSYCIKISGSASPTITGNTLTKSIYDSDWYTHDGGTGIFIEGPANPLINQNNIFDHPNKNLINNSTNAINAEYSWWGSASGFAGTIVGNVDYDPWALSPY